MAEQTYNSLTDDGGPLYIKELTGDKRTVALFNHTMPYRPLPFAGKHRIGVTAYAGFPTKTQQPMGAEEDNTAMNGRWCDVFMGADDDGATVFGSGNINNISSTADAETVEISVSQTKISTARDLAELIDDIRRKGQLLRVQWAHLVRIGRIEKFEQKWLNVHDVEWDIEFNWQGRDESVATATPANPSINTSAADVSKAYLALQDDTSFAGLDDLNPRFADLVDVHVTALQQAIANAENTIAARASGITDAVDAMRRAISTYQYVQDTSDLLISQLTSTAAASCINYLREVARVDESVGLGKVTALDRLTHPESRDLTGASYGQVLSAACAIAQSLRTARRLGNAAGRQRVRLSRLVEADVIAVLMITDEQDLRDLALAYYDSAEEWYRIARYNGISGSQVEAGTVILIPSRGAAA
jgi:hypothetical protein